MLTVEEETVSGETAQDDEISVELVAVIAAAATAFLGKRLRIRGIAEVRNAERMSRWTRQGRVLVQASHNLAAKHPHKAH